MKKLLTILLMLLLVFFCSACSDTHTVATDPHFDHTHTNAPSSATSADNNFSTEEHSHTTENETTVSTDASVTASDSTDKPSFDTPIKGIYSDNQYKNPVLGFSFTTDKEWVIYSDTELAYLSGLSEDVYSDFNTALNTSPAVYDLYAVHKESGTVISLCYENLLITSGNTLSAGEYLDSMKTAVEGAGVSEIQINGSIEFCGRTYENAVITSVSASEKTQQTYYLYALNNHMATLIITTKSDTPDTEILQMFN